MSADVRYFSRLLEHDRWANAETLRSLMSGDPPLRAVRWMGHILGAEHLWLARLKQETSTMSVWPEIDLYGCEARLEELDDLCEATEKGWAEAIEQILDQLSD